MTTLRIFSLYLPLLPIALVLCIQTAYATNASCKKKQWPILQQLHQAQKCTTNYDCSSIKSYPCPFGCHIPLNQHAPLNNIEQQINTHLQHCTACKKSCSTPPTKKTACIAGLCTYASDNAPTFPLSPDTLTLQMDITPTIHTNKKGLTTYRWSLDDGIYIRHESHPDNLEPHHHDYYPRHHGAHYHVTLRKPKYNKTIKVRPQGYILGIGTGFLPGETMPSFLHPYIR